jgi:hypothetical protein
MLFFVVPGLAHVELLVLGKASRPTLVEARDKHDKASIKDVFYRMITVLSRLDNLVREEVLLKLVDCLLRAVVPAGINPPLPRAVLPSSEDLRHDGFGKVIGVSNMDPVACHRMSVLLACTR